ncbi:fasciclin domain-containing protein [Corynebacterium sp.]|uniref:fasciclin domain-containing protein n=1 Tax=Corynebacterium sp. TaxID=1720 RepID=UPI003B3AC91B
MKKYFAAAGAAALVISLAACSDDSDDDSATTTAVATSESAQPSSTTDPSGTSDTMEGDIVDTAESAGDFTTLLTAVQAAGLEDTLRGAGPFTVFAPTDEAFSALPANTLDDLLADPEGDLANILKYHIVEGRVMAADVAEMNGETVTTVLGQDLEIEVDGDTVYLVDSSGNRVTVTATDVECSNGVIHVIDGVLIPADDSSGDSASDE